MKPTQIKRQCGLYTSCAKYLTAERINPPETHTCLSWQFPWHKKKKKTVQESVYAHTQSIWGIPLSISERGRLKRGGEVRRLQWALAVKTEEVGEVRDAWLHSPKKPRLNQYLRGDSWGEGWRQRTEQFKGTKLIPELKAWSLLLSSFQPATLIQSS